VEPKSIKLRNAATLTIREAKKEDAGQILEYVEKIAGETDFLNIGPGDFNLSLEDEEKYILSCLESPNGLFIVAEVAGTLVGSITFKGGDKSRIEHVGDFGCSILKEYWDLGIGSIMIETLIGWAKSSGIIKKLNLRVRPDNDRAVRLYERFNFVREGLTTREYFINGKFYDSIFMGLEID